MSGRGEVTGGGYSYTVVAGQSARFSGTDQLNYDIAQLPRADDFDNWAFQRDHREDGAESANYVSPEMTGYEDLDDYGRWQYVGGYGTVWVPSGVASDWAPYRNGHWAYIESLGMDLGGRRALGFRALPLRTLGLCRKPLVLGAGAGCGQAGVCAGAGGICRRSWNLDRRRPGRGLVPAGPGRSVCALLSGQPQLCGAGQRNQHRGERHPGDHTSINQRNVTNITYVNQRVNNGVTLVSRDTFVNARPVARNLGRFDARQLANARVERRIDVQPIRASVLGSGAPARFRPPQAIINRQVVATQRPAPPRQPFEQRQTRSTYAPSGPVNSPGSWHPALGIRAPIVRWRDRNRQSARRRLPPVLKFHGPRPVRSGRLSPRGWKNRHGHRKAR